MRQPDRFENFTRERKPIGWRGSSLADLRSCTPDVRRQAGTQLAMLQDGQLPKDWKPLSAVGPGAIEIRIHTKVEHRAVVVAKFAEAVYVLHVFGKKARRTSHYDLDLAKRRYQDLIAERNQR